MFNTVILFYFINFATSGREIPQSLPLPYGILYSCYSVGLGSFVSTEQLYPPLFTLSGARHEPAPISRKNNARTTPGKSHMMPKKKKKEKEKPNKTT